MFGASTDARNGLEAALLFFTRPVLHPFSTFGTQAAELHASCRELHAQPADAHSSGSETPQSTDARTSAPVFPSFSVCGALAVLALQYTTSQ